MAIEYKDIIRLEGTTLTLPSTCKAGQVGFETDGSKRMRREMVVDGVVLHWTPDEHFTSDLVGYENANYPQLTTLKLATDYILGNSNLNIEPIYIVNDKVGIGTTQPTKTLDISGQMNISSTIYCSSNIVSNSTAGLTIKMNTEDGSDDKYIIICSGGDNLPSRGASIMLCGDDEASTPGSLFIKNGDNGNIAIIGQTYINIKPTNNLYDFAIGKYMTFKDFGDESLITHNAYYDFGVGWKYRENGHGATSLGVDSTGLHMLSAEEGTKDASITWNNGLCVTNGGNVGVGTNSPATKLQVNGNMRITENLLVGYGTTGSTSSPAFLSLGTSQADTPVREKCKLYLYSDASTELYGFGVGTESDIQYHSNGTHDFFVENNKIASVNSVGIGIGTTNPSNKLDVNGNVLIMNNLKVGIGNTEPIENYVLNISGTSYFQNDAKFNSNILSGNNDLLIMTSTPDGDDFRFITICGGGAPSITRGGNIVVNGNEEVSNPGSVVINAGNGNGYVSGKILLSNGNVGIGTNGPTQTLDVDGNARFRSIGSDASSGALYYAADGTLTTNASDARLKHDIKDLDELTLQKLLDLRPVSFKWNGSDVESLGLIAQEVQEVFPELVFTNENTGFLGVRYELLNSLLLKALKQQNEIISNILERLEKSGI